MERTKRATIRSFKPPGDERIWRDLIDTTSETDDENKKQKEKDRIKQAQDDLHNMLLSSLQMQHLVVLAGAGCSRYAKGPSMKELWETIVGDPPSREATLRAEQVNYDLTEKNIEKFLSNIESYLNIRKTRTIKRYLDSCKRTILDKCSNFVENFDLETHKTFLHRLSRRRVRDQRLKIFTTNYDLCFERAASELGCPVLDGFSFSTPRFYDPRFFGYDIIRRPCDGEGLGQYLEGVFILYKLHGSVNWAHNPDGTIREKDKPSSDEACLIYPASGKYQQSYVQPYLESISQYLSALREPNTCLIVAGFGFNDNHLAEPLLAATKSNPNLRLIIIDPTAKSKLDPDVEEKPSTTVNPYWSRLLDLNLRGEDVWFIQAGFADFTKMIPDLKSLTPAESLMKAVKGVM